MKVGKIIPCACTPEPDLIANGYAGMPILRTYGGADAYFDVKCPKCGSGGFRQFKSAYLALKDWNEMQKELQKGDQLAVQEEDRADERCSPLRREE